jgi:hypothetical protein
MKFRKPVELGERFNKRWLGYAAAAGAAGLGLLGIPPAANADIIYTPAGYGVSGGGPGGGGVFPISVTGNGIDDFQFRGFVSYVGGRSSGGKLYFARLGVGNGFEVGPLSKGIAIGAGDKFISRSGETLLASGYRENYGQYEGLRGPWVNVKDKFLGLKLNVNGQTHFGWAELSVSVGGNGGFVVTGYLEGYAYNTMPQP